MPPHCIDFICIHAVLVPTAHHPLDGIAITLSLLVKYSKVEAERCIASYI